MNFIDFCNIRKNIIKAALNRKRLEETEDGWESFPCTKEESIEMALEAFDAVVYEAEQLRLSGLALEQIMKNHGLELGRDYTLNEYMQTVEQIKRKEGKSVASTIRVVK